jgi:hypothetical protein
MNDAFEIYPEDIEQLETIREFNIWLNAIDNAIEIENLDPLIEYLISVNRYDFVMAALDFKHKYLTDEN